MIFYFSATGNSKHVAERIAAVTGDRLIPMQEYFQGEEMSFALTEGESVGFVSPTYAWGLPLVTEEFCKKLRARRAADDPYVWYLATYGTSPGQSGYFANAILREKGLPVRAYFSVKMPDTWTPTYDLSDPAKVAKLNEAAETQIDAAAEKIKAHTPGDFMEHKAPALAAKVFYRMTYDKMRETKHLHATDVCIGCGLCARKCPVQAIEIQDRRPVWVKDHCVMCLGCLHRCPKFAIQYDDRTKDHGQYTWKASP